AGDHAQRARHRLADRRLADPGPSYDRLFSTDQHARHALIRAAGPQLQRGLVADQLSPRVVVGSVEQRAHWNINKSGIAIPSLAVGEGELGGFNDDMDKIRSERIEIVEIEPLQQRQLLQEYRALAPWPALGQGVPMIIKGERCLDRRLPARKIVASQ